MSSRNNRFQGKDAKCCREESLALVLHLHLSFFGHGQDTEGFNRRVGILVVGLPSNIIACQFSAITKRGLISGLQETTACCLTDVPRILDLALPELVESPVVVVDFCAQYPTYEKHVSAGLTRSTILCCVIGFEPLECRQLGRGRANEDEVAFLPDFVGNFGSDDLCIDEPDATASLLSVITGVTSRLLELNLLRTLRAEGVSTTTLGGALGAQRDIGYLEFDIQGFELTALQAARVVLDSALVVHWKVSFVEIYEKQALLSNIEEYVRSVGFDLVGPTSLRRYPISGTLSTTSRDWPGSDEVASLHRPSTDASWQSRLGRGLMGLVVYRTPSLTERLVWSLRGASGASLPRALGSFGD